MISFSSDYMEGALPEILKRFSEVNFEQLTGYGSDKYSESARAKIRAAVGSDQADVYFLVGGTQTNRVVISTMLRPYEGVVAVTTGHVALHEAGAIENSGHKVLALPGKDAKLQAETLKKCLEEFYADENHDHMVFPGMVYISYPTEYGTLYTKSELQSLHEICAQYDIPLFIDGARLGYGLASDACDMTLAEIASLCDVFYIGGTKVGALCGEAVVFPKGNAPKQFMTMVKQEGALLAKGWVTGLSFDTLFTDNLYYKAGRHAIVLANRIKSELSALGFTPYIDSPTNQQFFALTPDKLAKVKEKVGYGFWENLPDGRTVIRFATSWATTEENVDYLINLMRSLRD